MEWAYTTPAPWHAKNRTAAALATNRRVDLENRNMARILAARTLERKRCAAADLIWINIAECASEHYYRLGGDLDVRGMT